MFSRLVIKSILFLIYLLILVFIALEVFYFYKVYRLDLEKINIEQTYSEETLNILALTENTQLTHSHTFSGFVYDYILLYKNKKLNKQNASIAQKLGADYLKKETKPKNKIKNQTNEKTKQLAKITQKAISKNVLAREDNFDKHLNNFITTFWLEKNYQAQDLNNLYLNQVYLGNFKNKNVWGLNNAAQQYFNKDIDKLSIHQTTALLSLIKNPHYFNPNKNPFMFEQRNRYLIDLMKINYPIKYHKLNYKKVL